MHVLTSRITHMYMYIDTIHIIRIYVHVHTYMHLARRVRYIHTYISMFKRRPSRFGHLTQTG